MHEGCAAARSGLAAVMGSKQLKAFAVRGTKKVPPADAKRFAALRKDYLKSVKGTEHPSCTCLLVFLSQLPWSTLLYFSYTYWGQCAN
ncbi:hypothetical protein ES703_26160 [subsurface metagenome]